MKSFGPFSLKKLRLGMLFLLMISFLISPTHFLKMERQSIRSASSYDFSWISESFLKLLDLRQAAFRFIFSRVTRQLASERFPLDCYWGQESSLMTVSTLTNLALPLCSCSFSRSSYSYSGCINFWFDCTRNEKVLLLVSQADVKGRFSIAFSLSSGKSCLEYGLYSDVLLCYDNSIPYFLLAALPFQFCSLDCSLSRAVSKSLFLRASKCRLFLHSALSACTSFNLILSSAISLSLATTFSKSLSDSSRKIVSCFSRASMRSRCTCSLLALREDCLRSVSISSLTFFTCIRQAYKNSPSCASTIACTFPSTVSTYFISYSCVSLIISSFVLRLLNSLLLRRLADAMDGASGDKRSSTGLEADLRMRSTVRKGPLK